MYPLTGGGDIVRTDGARKDLCTKPEFLHPGCLEVRYQEEIMGLCPSAGRGKSDTLSRSEQFPDKGLQTIMIH